MRILLVGGDPSGESLLKGRLSGEGNVVEGADIGRLRAETLETHDLDVVIIDASSRDESWLEAVRDLRHQDATLPVVFLSLRDSTEDRVRGLDAGADDYVVKPLEYAELDARLRALLRRIARAQERSMG